jgi:hypothetical protein
MIKGHITICKVYKDGTKDIVLENQNLITGGFGYSFSDLLSQGGSNERLDYAPGYFAVGTSSVDFDASLATSADFYNLSAPLSWEEYGLDSTLYIEKLNRGFPASTVDSGVSYSELYFTTAPLSSVVFSSSPAYLAKTSPNFLTNWIFDSMESEISLDETTANGKTISEIGLFSTNPKGLNSPTPVMIAYKTFTGIPKTSEFSLVFHWSIGYIGMSPTININSR